MAGENETLDMSLFDLSALPEVPDQTEESVVEKEIKEEPVIVDETTAENTGTVTDINDQADGENQETVGSQEEESTEEETSIEQTTESPANSDDEVYKTLGTYLKEQGVLSSLDTDLDSLESFAEAVSKEIKSNEYANLNKDQKAYLTALSKGVPEELYKAHVQSNKIYGDLTDAVIEEREDVRKEVIIQDLLSQGWEQGRAEKQYQRVFDVGDSVEEAKISRNNLKQRDNTAYEQEVKRIEQDKVAAEQAKTKQVDDLKKSVYEQSNLFDTFKITDGLKDRVHNSMTKVVGHTESGMALNALMKHRMDDPIDFETKLYYLYELTNGLKDIKKFSNKASTVASKKVKEAVTNSSIFNTTSNNNFAQKEDLKGGSPIVDIE